MFSAWLSFCPFLHFSLKHISRERSLKRALSCVLQLFVIINHKNGIEPFLHSKPFCDYKSQNRNRKIPIFLTTYSIALFRKAECFGFAFVIYNHKLVISCRLRLEKPHFLCKNRNSTKIPLAPHHKRALSFENARSCFSLSYKQKQ